MYRRIFGHISSLCDGSATRVTRVLQHGQMGSLLGSAGSLSSLGTLSVGSFVGASSFGFSAAPGFRDSCIDSSGASTSRASGTVPSSSGPSVEPVSTPSTPISSSTPVSTPFTPPFSSIGTVVSSGVLGIAESSGTTNTFGATKNLKKLDASEIFGSVDTLVCDQANREGNLADHIRSVRSTRSVRFADPVVSSPFFATGADAQPATSVESLSDFSVLSDYDKPSTSGFKAKSACMIGTGRIDSLKSWGSG